ncbi:MAG: alanine racemase [Alphaproteobacteria bacterium]|nr:alanine racemase [Alphaproteobacteria bacterium]
MNRNWVTPLRLDLEKAALVHNWRWLTAQSGQAACGAAIKANGYGLGAQGVLRQLAGAGCRDFFVASWCEALALEDMPEGCALSVLHGVRDEDMAVAVASLARPTLNSLAQISRWRETGKPCDVMIDTGINRLGIAPEDVFGGALDGLNIDTLMSHLACADEDSAMNGHQLAAFRALAGRTTARRLSLANSAGICLGADYAFDLTRPGLALYGGVPRAEAAGQIKQVAHPQAQILQRRILKAGDSIGYNATFTAQVDMPVAIINLGYADGILRAFAGVGTAEGGRCAILGRVSMDLIALDVLALPEAKEGDWLTLDYALPSTAACTGLSQYELLTGLGSRFERVWR